MYRNKFDDVSILYLGSGAFENIPFSKKIEDENYECLVFIDHRLNPNFIIDNLSQRMILSTKFIFHIFGNIYNRIEQWLSLTKKIEGAQVHYNFCSEKFLNLAKIFFDSQNHKSMNFCPILSKVKYQKKIVKNTILYTGRLSPSKNIDGLIWICEKLRHKRKDFKLQLIGSFDEYNHYENAKNGSYQMYLTQLILKYSDFVEFVPFQKELDYYYNEAKVYFSLSTMEGEDYGMSVAEALGCGMNVVLSDWGGYSSFKEFEGVHLMDISYQENKFSFNESQILETLDKLLSQEDTNRENRVNQNLQLMNHKIETYNAHFSKQEVMNNKKVRIYNMSYSSDLLKENDLAHYLNFLKELK